MSREPLLLCAALALLAGIALVTRASLRTEAEPVTEVHAAPARSARRPAQLIAASTAPRRASSLPATQGKRPQPPVQDARAQPTAAASVSPPAERGSIDRVQHTARALGWPEQGWQARTLADWTARTRSAERAWLGHLAEAAPEPADVAAFNAAAARRCAELVRDFGRSDAESLAARMKLHRVDAGSGALVRVTLDGKPWSWSVPDD